MSPDGKLGTYLVLSSFLHSTVSSTGFGRKKIPHPEGKPGKIGKWVTRREGLIGAFRQFGTQLSWTIQELLPGPWEGGDHSTPAQRLGEHSLPWLGLEIQEAGPTTFQRNKKTIIFNKWRQ